MIPRIYEKTIIEHFEENRQMLFISGPRQTGKTTTCLLLKNTSKSVFYFSWDNIKHKELILKGPNDIANEINLGNFSNDIPYVIFDEIHKFSKWKEFLKGLYDTFPNQAHIIVTGSARLDFFKKGGDSLMGRYFLLRHHPLSVAELTTPFLHEKDIRTIPTPLKITDFDKLLKFGGYPDPYVKANYRFYNRWKSLRFSQLFHDDLQDLSRIQEIGQIELLAELLTRQIGQLTTYDSLAKKVRVSSNTVKSWLKTLQALYYCFEVRPYSKNISRSLLKEPKYYLWDWSLCTTPGMKAENFIASHLLKATHFWTDYGFGNYLLYYVRDKSKNEVDFLVTKDDKPMLLVEVKHNNKNLSKNLEFFQKQLHAKYAFQVVMDMPYINKNCFIGPSVQVVPAQTFLSQLV